MKNSIEFMVSKRCHQGVNMIRHDYVFAKEVALIVKEFQRVFNDSEDFRTRQNAGTVRISQMKGHKVSHGCLSLMREVASTHLKFGVRIEEIKRIHNICSLCCLTS